MTRFSDARPDIETSSDAYANRFRGTAGRYFLSVQQRSVVDLLTNSITSVLDVGGGHAQLTSLFVERNYAITVYGSDESCHRRIKEEYSHGRIEHVTGDLLKLPFVERNFDLVVAIRLVSHVAAWEQLISELCRVAKQSVIIDFPSVRSLNAFTPILFGLKKRIEGNTRTYTSFSRCQLERSFRMNGFDVVCMRPQFFFPMVVHRALKGWWPLQSAESRLRGLGVTHFFGSPVLLRADRRTAI